MNDTPTQLVQPPPHDLPTSPATYNSWAITGVVVYVVAFGLLAGGLALWHELRCLRRSAEALLGRLAELRRPTDK
jgi:hypothetical protein